MGALARRRDQAGIGLVGASDPGPGGLRAAAVLFMAAHQPAIAQAIVDVVNTDHPSDKQLVAMARQYFAKHDAMGADPTQL
mgnify:CR=1 FL=1